MPTDGWEGAQKNPKQEEFRRMAIDIYSETLWNISEAHKHLPRKPSGLKLRKWIDDGLLSRAGRRVQLECVKVGGELCTSREAFERFCRALSQSPDDLEMMEESEDGNRTE